MRARVAGCAHMRARALRWLAPERGDTLIEVMVAAIMVAVVAGATLTGYAQVAHMTSTQRHRVEADSLAELDQARLRGLTITQLAGPQGNRATSETVDGTTYTTTSTSQYVSGTSAVMSCTTGPTTTTADEVQITSSVTWSPGNDGRVPVIVHGLVTPAEGGSLVITATDPSGAGMSGVTATPSGPTTVSPLATDANGCAIFGGLAGGTYTVGFADPGYVDVNGNPNPSQTKTVIPTETAGPVNEQMGQAATINATFSTKWNGNTVAATDDQIVVTQNLMTPPFRVFGTDSTASNSTFVASVTTGATMFPFTSAYLAFAGGCDDPLTPAGAEQSVIVSPGGTSSVTLPEPAMLVMVWSGTSASPGSLVSTKPDVTVTDTDAACGNAEDYPPSQIPTASGGALANPGLPYGAYTVCADAQISGTYERNTGTVANTNYAAGDTVNIYLGSGAAGRSAGKCP
jgi:Tfp pilus assembly protein PilE